MRSTVQSNVLPEESNIMLCADYKGQWEDDAKARSIEPFTFLGHDQFIQRENYSLLADYIYVETILEDDLDWGEKGLIAVQIILTDEVCSLDQDRQELLKDHNLIGKETAEIRYPVILGIAHGFDSSYDESKSLELSGKELLEIEIFRSFNRDKVTFLILGK